MNQNKVKTKILAEPPTQIFDSNLYQKTPVLYKQFIILPKSTATTEYTPITIKVPRYTSEENNSFTPDDLLNFLTLLLNSKTIAVNLSACFDGDKPKAIEIWKVLQFALEKVWSKSKQLPKYIDSSSNFVSNKLD